MENPYEPAAARQGMILPQGRLMESLNYLRAEKDEDGRIKVYPRTKDSMLPQFFLGIEAPDNDVVVDDSMYIVTEEGLEMTLLQVAERAGGGVAVRCL